MLTTPSVPRGDFWLLGTGDLAILKISKIVFMSFKKIENNIWMWPNYLPRKHAKNHVQMLGSFLYMKKADV
jgi:hypothetical protein